MAETENNIVLIGMPASGKSTVGVILAKILGMDFMDTDILIQQSTGMRLNEIIDEQGVDGFLKVEEKTLLGIDVRNTVIATGGSAVYSADGIKHLAGNSVIIYLSVDRDRLKARLKNIKERGVVLRPGESFDEMFDNRTGLYEKYADITIVEDGTSIEDTVSAIRAALKAGM
jgi:shikimate kinase